MKTVRNKRTSLWEKVWYIIKPFLIYMAVKSAAMLTLMMLVPAIPVSGMEAWVEAHALLLKAVINAAASIVGVSFLLNDFLKETAVAGEVDIDAGVLRQLWAYFRKGFWGYKDVNPAGLALCAGLGAASAYVLNWAAVWLFAFLGIASAEYDAVEAIQYSVPLWLGILLYGVVSPLAEEIVFRGILYNRMKKFFGLPLCVVLTALLFGAFHANLPQFLYGTCMGLLIALCYEKEECFAAPVLFHMAANLFVFIASFF